jgi:multidrug efflux pump subunit AcrA (membrane-fusion protein)
MKGAWIRILGLLLFVGLLAVGGGWWMMRGQGGTVLPAEPAEAHAASVASESKPLPAVDRDTLTLPGVIEPYESVPVSAKLTAAIASMHVRDGSMVSKAQSLCTLESDELTRQIDSARLALMQAQETLRRARETRANDAQRKAITRSNAERDLASFQADSQLQLQQAEAELKRAERELADQQALYQAKAVSADQVRAKQEAVEDAKRSLEQRRTAAEAGLDARRKALEQAQLEARTEAVSEKDLGAYELAGANARAELAERQKRLADLRVVAPVSGTVRFIPRTRTSSMMATGQSAEVLGPGVRVYEGDPFLEIATTERACVRVDVDETDIRRLHVGMKAKIAGDAFAGRELEGEVSEIQTAGRRAGQGVSLFPVTVRITSPLKDVRMGMTADVTIKLAKDDSADDGGKR